MKIGDLHTWDVSPREAVDIQKRLWPFLHLKKLQKTIRYVAGTDVSSSKGSDTIWAGVVLFSYPDLVPIEERWIKERTGFPYIPGLLSFREIPALLKALETLEKDPDLILCDGQGIAHPRGMGLASHLGILLKKPTIGCAKSRLVGEFSEVGLRRGDYGLLSYKGRDVGAVVRTKTNVKPLFISPGYAIMIDEAVRMVLSCGGGYRIPEPIRKAHLLVTRLRERESL